MRKPAEIKANMEHMAYMKTKMAKYYKRSVLLYTPWESRMLQRCIIFYEIRAKRKRIKILYSIMYVQLGAWIVMFLLDIKL